MLLNNCDNTVELKESNVKKLCESYKKPEILNDLSSESHCKSINSSYSYCKNCDPKCKYFDCICDESWKSFDETLHNIKAVSSEILLESLRISTITLCFNLNSDIDTDKLSEKYVSKNNDT